VNLNIDTIYNELAAGEEITTLVPATDIANFRTRIYRSKKIAEEQLIGLEILQAEEVKMLQFAIIPSEDHPGYLEVTMKLQTRPRNNTYVILRKTPTNAAPGT